MTATDVTIGGTFPLGTIPSPAALYQTIPAAENAYYAWVNNHGQVHGRNIDFLTRDDAYSPALTVPAVKDLVENQHVYAIVGSLGTEPALSTWAYLNQHGVPQVLLATGDSYWGSCQSGGAFKPIAGVCATPKPWTIGWQPDYPGEARMYAKYILAHNANPHVGILYQNDAYGLNYRKAFRTVFANHLALGDIVAEQSYIPTTSVPGTDSFNELLADMGALKAAGADTVVLFSTPTPSIRALKTTTALSWHPDIYLNNVSANTYFMHIAEAANPLAANINGIISSTYIKSSSAAQFNGDPGVNLAGNIIAAYSGPGAAFLQSQYALGDSNIMYGLAVAWTFVDALKHAGLAPTRGSLMSALKTLNENPTTNTNPFIYPGMKVYTDSLVRFPMEQLQLQKWDSSVHDWSTAGMGGVVKSGK